MADEIKINLGVELSNGALKDKAPAISVKANQAAVGIDRYVDQGVASGSWESASFGSLTTPRICKVVNTSTHAWLKWGVSSTLLGRLRPGHAVNIDLGDSVTFMYSKLHVNVTFAAGTDTAKFDLSALGYTISGRQYILAALDEQAFGVTTTVVDNGADDGYGIIAFQANTSGTFSCKVPSASQTYTSSALALAALPTADTDNVVIGYVIIQTRTAHGNWVCGTDDLTNGSDLTTATFTSLVDTGSIDITAYEE